MFIKSILTGAIVAVGFIVAAALTSALALAGAAGCPVFTATMIDAAFLGARVTDDGIQEIVVVADDNPTVPSIQCQVTEGDGNFEVRVVSGEAFVAGFHFTGNSADVTIGTSGNGLTVGQMHACRAEILQSLAWNEYCVQAVP